MYQVSATADAINALLNKHANMRDVTRIAFILLSLWLWFICESLYGAAVSTLRLRLQSGKAKAKRKKKPYNKLPVKVESQKWKRSFLLIKQF